jgi:hypothetical protein
MISIFLISDEVTLNLWKRNILWKLCEPETERRLGDSEPSKN